MVKWFDAEEATNFGQSLGEFFLRRAPLNGRTHIKISQANQRAVINEMFRKIERFKSENNMNIYKKARFLNVFKWTLIEGGYSKEFVDTLTKELLFKF